jgi:predicted DNA-binding transcriptional regulator AlpA
MTLRPDPLAYPPRGMSRDEAARYIGVGVTKFDEMVADRRMPRPKRVDGRVIWDRLKIDAAFTDLPEEKKASRLDYMLAENPLDRMFK